MLDARSFSAKKYISYQSVLTAVWLQNVLQQFMIIYKKIKEYSFEYCWQQKNKNLESSSEKPFSSKTKCTPDG